MAQGAGLVSVRSREKMLAKLRQQGIADEVVLAVMAKIPRHLFLDAALETRAYEDHAWPIGAGQTISAPYSVARLCELLRQSQPLSKVLEVGTGCGYQTAVLASLCHEVYTVERIASLVAKARRHLQGLRVKNVYLKYGDATSIALPPELLFDGIVLTAAPTEVPQSLLTRLAVGGRMVLPLASAQAPKGQLIPFDQMLVVIERTNVGFHETVIEPARFVPLLNGVA